MSIKKTIVISDAFTQLTIQQHLQDAELLVGLPGLQDD